MQHRGGFVLASKALGESRLGLLLAHSFLPVEQVDGTSLLSAQMPLAAPGELGSPLPPCRKPTRVGRVGLP
jgi:hypothetical protein